MTPTRGQLSEVPPGNKSQLLLGRGGQEGVPFLRQTQDHAEAPLAGPGLQ
eukprot:CAMPEP_0194594174 /NCGR_PEP_ID=MMETSP0292-20121207/24041_1 /TAXON_ID=39354 /ORGANISM="Heterosigma akashiwo, Strain CCMP2393" /LENGTH=49 /DNA_ID= /DNA_START= /DNA_END= /DNA_ORIENTATION=